MPPTPTHRSRGGQPGNRNAIKHGYYSARFKTPDLADLASSDPATTLDEITLLRIASREVLAQVRQSSDLPERTEGLRILAFSALVIDQLIKTRRKRDQPKVDKLAARFISDLVDYRAKNLELARLKKDPDSQKEA